MIVIYNLDKPGVVFATHDNWQEDDVLAAYDGSVYGSVILSGIRNLTVGDTFEEDGGQSLRLVVGAGVTLS